jgi:hypothetical protein
MRGQSATHRARLVHRVTICNQKYFPPGLTRHTQQAAKEIYEYSGRETLTENHERQPPDS